MIEALLVAYLATTAPLLAEAGAWPWLALRGVVLLGIALGRLGRLPASVGRYYPFLVCYALYMELDHYAFLTRGRRYDDVVQGWEDGIFGTSPALWLCERWPSRALSEGVHACYAAFHLMVPGLALALVRARGDLEGLRDRNTLIWLTGFLFYLFFPVAGPRPLYPPLPPELHGPAYRLCHYLAGTGAAAAAAFPSLHAALSTLVCRLAVRWRPRLAWLVVPLTLGVLLGTVYGRFHYAVDTLAGAGLGLLISAADLRSTRWTRGTPAPARSDRGSGHRP